MTIKASDATSYYILFSPDITTIIVIILVIKAIKMIAMLMP